MRFKKAIYSTVSIVILSALSHGVWAQTAPATASTTPNNPTAEEEVIVVTGIRKSLESAQNIKRLSDKIIDGIVAEDIGKLPDIAVSETAARIPGIQVVRRGGEADTVLVRGLPDYATTYNGREIFTAETRLVALQDFPAANIAALEVFKSSSANLVEPGLAGLINIRSRRPFDFTGLELAGSVWGLNTRQAGKVTPNGNLLASNRWEVGGGEIGALLNVSYTEMDYLDSEISNTDFIAGGPSSSRFPDIQRLFYRAGNRQRPSVNGVVQWRPSPDLEFYAEALWQGFRNEVSDRLLSAPLWGGQQYTSLVFRDGTDLLQSGTVVNPFRPDGFQGGTLNQTDTFQFAIGGSYDANSLRLSWDVARTDSEFTGSTASVDYRFANRQTIVFNNGLPNGKGGGPEFSFLNFDWQARLDAEYETELTWLPKVTAGIRYNDRTARREFGNRFNQFDNRAVPISSVPLTYELFRAGFRGASLQQNLRTFLTPTYDSIRANRVELRRFVGALPAGNFSFGTLNLDDPAADPLQTYDASEKTTAIYIQGHYKIGENVDGLIGVRAVKTENKIAGTSLLAQADPDGAGPRPAPPSIFQPVSVGQDYVDWLPNVSLRWRILPELQLRLSATQTRTRPTFGQLNPSATLGPPPTNCAPNQSDPFACGRTGGGGNPFLKPFTSDNYDASLEYYFARAGFASVAIFRRDLDGFIQNQQVRYIDPELGPLVINGPVNTGSGQIDGIEAQFSTFLDIANLPEWLHAFGIQANVTSLNAKTGFPDASGKTQLDRILGVAKLTYNIAGFYEKGPLSVRLSYNKRGKSLETRQNRGDDLYLETAYPGGRLDLSSSYKINDRVSVFLDWTNISPEPFRQDLSSARAGATRAEYTRYFRYEEEVISLGTRFRF
jgi:iron complex outermembrane recepter protein